MIDLTKSKAAFEEAKKYMPGGVNSPVRSYPHMGCPPPFIQEAHGSHITDIDGNTYIDYVGSWGPMVLGHAHPLRGEGAGHDNEQDEDGEADGQAFSDLEVLEHEVDLDSVRWVGPAHQGKQWRSMPVVRCLFRSSGGM